LWGCYCNSVFIPNKKEKISIKKKRLTKKEKKNHTHRGGKELPSAPPRGGWTTSSLRVGTREVGPPLKTFMRPVAQNIPGDGQAMLL
jgi:hypothetical protein